MKLIRIILNIFSKTKVKLLFMVAKLIYSFLPISIISLLKLWFPLISILFHYFRLFNAFIGFFFMLVFVDFSFVSIKEFFKALSFGFDFIKSGVTYLIDKIFKTNYSLGKPTVDVKIEPIKNFPFGWLKDPNDTPLLPSTYDSSTATHLTAEAYRTGQGLEKTGGYTITDYAKIAIGIVLLVGFGYLIYRNWDSIAGYRNDKPADPSGGGGDDFISDYDIYFKRVHEETLAHRVHEAVDKGKAKALTFPEDLAEKANNQAESSAMGATRVANVAEELADKKASDAFSSFNPATILPTAAAWNYAYERLQEHISNPVNKFIDDAINPVSSTQGGDTILRHEVLFDASSNESDGTVTPRHYTPVMTTGELTSIEGIIYPKTLTFPAGMTRDAVLTKLNEFNGDIDALSLNFRNKLVEAGGGEVSDILTDLTGGYKMFLTRAELVHNRASMKIAQSVFETELEDGISKATKYISENNNVSTKVLESLVDSLEKIRTIIPSLRDKAVRII